MEVVSPAPIPVPYLPRRILCPDTNDTILTHRVSEVDKRKMYSKYTTEFDLATEEFIEAGAFGVVVRCKNIIDKQTYAIKKVSIGARGADDVDGKYANLEREFIILAKFDHPSVVRYHTTWIESTFVGTIDGDSTSDGTTGGNSTSIGKTGEGTIDRTKPCLYIQQQICDCTLKDKMTMTKALTKVECCRIFSALVHGLNHIHGHNVMHGDLKAANVFFFEEKVRIGDFGLSRIIGETDDKIVLTGKAPQHAAPDEVVSAKADVYSLGILLAEMVLNEKSARAVFDVIEELKKEEPEFPQSWPDGVLKTWITKMLKGNREERRALSEILKFLPEIEGAIMEFKDLKLH